MKYNGVVILIELLEWVVYFWYFESKKILLSRDLIMGRLLYLFKMFKMKFIISFRKSFNRVGVSGMYLIKWILVIFFLIMLMKE